MPLELKSFRSKVSRRIFLLFVVCALVPVTLLSWLSYDRVKKEIMEQNHLRIRQACGAIGVSIFERLILLQTELEILSGFIEVQETPFFRGDRYFPEDILKRHFHAVALIHPNGSMHPLLGETGSSPGLSRSQEEFLHQKGALLLVEKGIGTPHKILMLRPVKTKSLEPFVLLAVVNGDYVWEASELKPYSSELVLSGPDETVLFSTLPDPKDALGLVSADTETPENKISSHQTGSREFFVGKSAVYLKSGFYSPDWNLFVAEPTEKWLGPLHEFGLIFPILFLFTLSLVVVLSVGQIRKTTRPIDILKEGTLALASGDLDHRVEIHSQDEFEDLAASFNGMAENLKRSRELLVRTAKMSTIGQMAAGIFHEIKQPLSAIYGLLELSLIMDSPEKRRRNLENALKATERMNGILTRFKTFSHTSEGSMTPVALSNVVKEVHALFDYQLAKTGVLCTLTLNPGMPLILGDPQALQQVVSNLVVNSMDALEEGPQSKREIHISTFADGDSVCLKVSDTGCGIPPEILEKIFNPFFTTKEAGKGTGLGMAIIESILHKHKSRIHVQSEPGNGTDILVSFPPLNGKGSPLGASPGTTEALK